LLAIPGHRHRLVANPPCDLFHGRPIPRQAGKSYVVIDIPRVRKIIDDSLEARLYPFPICPTCVEGGRLRPVVALARRRSQGMVDGFGPGSRAVVFPTTVLLSGASHCRKNYLRMVCRSMVKNPSAADAQSRRSWLHTRAF
jgi:hypothetical protein